jgi:hypothetical protein
MLRCSIRRELCARPGGCLSAARPCGLHRRTLHRPERAEHAAIAGLRGEVAVRQRAWVERKCQRESVGFLALQSCIWGTAWGRVLRSSALRGLPADPRKADIQQQTAATRTSKPHPPRARTRCFSFFIEAWASAQRDAPQAVRAAWAGGAFLRTSALFARARLTA